MRNLLFYFFFCAIFNINAQTNSNKWLVQSSGDTSSAGRLKIDNEGNVYVFGLFQTKTFKLGNKEITNVFYTDDLDEAITED